MDEMSSHATGRAVFRRADRRGDVRGPGADHSCLVNDHDRAEWESAVVRVVEIGEEARDRLGRDPGRLGVATREHFRHLRHDRRAWRDLGR
jgi:hypothetical protein